LNQTSSAVTPTVTHVRRGRPAKREIRWAQVLTPSAVWAILLVALLIGWLFWNELSRIHYNWYHKGEWTHGYLVPLFCLYFLHLQREKLARIEVRGSWFGLVVLLGALGVYFVNLWNYKIGYLSDLCILASIAGSTLLIGGWKILRVAAFPIFFLIFAIPLPPDIYSRISYPFQWISAYVASTVLNFHPSVEADVSGVIIDYIKREGGVMDPTPRQLNVETACSGMRLLVALTTLGVALTYLRARPLWQRIVLLVAVPVITLICNMVRVTLLGVVIIFVGAEWGSGALHSLIGLLVMVPLAILMFSGLSWVLDNLYVEEEVEPTPKPAG
jgi:exosortase